MRKFFTDIEASFPFRFVNVAGIIIGLITTIRNQDALIRFLGILVAIATGVILIHSMRSNIAAFARWLTCNIAAFARWLTWKFILGVVAGVVATILMYPFALPLLQRSASSVEVINTVPTNNSVLPSAHAAFSVYFSEEMPRSQWEAVRIKISPDYPIERTWTVPDLSMKPPNDPNYSKELTIRPIKYFANEELPRFEYSETYQIEIAGGPVKKKIIRFQTPAQQQDDGN